MPRPVGKSNQPNLFALLKPYRGMVIVLTILTIAGNALNLAVPKLISKAIDDFSAGRFDVRFAVVELALIAVGIFIFVYFQSIMQTYASERVAKDLRTDLAAKISVQEYAYIQQVTPSALLTNLTSDIDAIKLFVSQAIVSIVSSVFLIIGASALLLIIDWKLALAVLATLPVIAICFAVIFGRIRSLFKKAQETIDWLNKVINESILGSALIRLLNSQQIEYQKFLRANEEAKGIGLKILQLFASLIPIVTFVSNLAALIILGLGGHYVIMGAMTLGDFTAFNSYLSILIFPIIMLGFMSNVIAQASASYARISGVLFAPAKPPSGHEVAPAGGDLGLKGVSLVYGEKNALKDVSCVMRAGTKTAIIGPTAAGKTQLLYLLTGLIRPTAGVIEYAGRPIDAYEAASLHRRIAFVFQDSVMFNLTLRENIAFSEDVKEAEMKKAIETAELHDFIDALPEGLETIVSERGTSLSGGQKQRIMLARALALNPSVLLLDDFTARVDAATERKILTNVERNYQGMTIVSVTQKISSVEAYDQIMVLMEGELLASGTHQELMDSSPEYVQIVESQRSTNEYELRA